jgi:hypothetical protein
MPGVALSTRPNGAIGIGLAYRVASLTPNFRGGLSLQLRQPIRRTIHGSLVELLSKLYLLIGKVFGPVDGCPGGRCVPTPQELPVLLGVALTAVFGRQRLSQREAPVLEGLLPFLGLVAIQAVRSLLHMCTALVFGHDGGGLAAMAGGARARSLHKIRAGLLRLERRTLGLNEKGPDDERSANHEGNEDRFERFQIHHNRGRRDERGLPVQKEARVKDSSTGE